VASLIAEYIRLAYQDSCERYEYVVQHAFRYGYELEYSERWKGNIQIRDHMNAVAKSCASEPHRILSTNLVLFFEKVSLEHQDKWFYHDLRLLLQGLLANYHCAEESATTLGDMLDKINDISH